MVYDFSYYFGVICSCAGIVFFLYSFILIRKIKKLFPGSNVTKKWMVREILILIFLVGYVSNIIFLTLELTAVITFMTAFVYFFGGIFVLIIINLVYTTYKTILLEYSEKK
jgi:hypothetical protein